MSVTLIDYKEILKNVEFWKFNVHLYYRDVEFKFRNTGAGNNGASKLTIFGITPEIGTAPTSEPEDPNDPTFLATQGRDSNFIPRKEYVIYTELRGINLERWNVRVPYILDGGSTTPGGGYNVLGDTPRLQAAGYRIEAGIGYNSINELSTEKFYPGSRLRMFWGWSYNTATDIAAFSFFDINGDEGFTYKINPSTLLKQDIKGLYDTYQEHPCVVLYSTNTSVDLTNRKFYNVVPVGIEYYKVKLELANGESVTRFFDTSWNPVVPAGPTLVGGPRPGMNP